MEAVDYVKRALNKMLKLEEKITGVGPGEILEEVGFFISNGQMRAVIEYMQTAQQVLENENDHSGNCSHE